MSWPLTCCKGLEIPGGKVSRADSWVTMSQERVLSAKKETMNKLHSGDCGLQSGKKRVHPSTLSWATHLSIVGSGFVLPFQKGFCGN